MSLETYRRKRRFDRTPEPAGAPEPGRGTPPSGNRRFVVQRHRATRLHYDFRLEIDGVLMSWAVPKGPSLDAAATRMAVHVEDHPLEYFDFEGVIPRGQYGGGDVIVWDWGTFEPEETDDPGRAARNGELKFALHGEKLRGRFTLVRTGGRGAAFAAEGDGKEQWLLIHKRDEFAQPCWNIDAYPQSVKTGRINDEVKAGLPAVWDSGAPAASAAIDLSAARQEPLPDFIEPMKATLADDVFSDPDWLFEIKWDGYRVEAVVDNGPVRLWTRNHNDAARYFPELTARPTWIDAKQAIVDGEVVALGPNGDPDFSALQDRTGVLGRERGGRSRGKPRPSAEELAAIPLAYQVFDLLYLDGRSLLDVPLETRKRLLRSVLRDHHMVRYGSHVEADGEAFHAAARERGLEGIIAKHRSSRYEPGKRVRTWLKLKLRREQELVVAGYVPGKGAAADLGALIVGVYEDGQLRHAGQVGSGFSAKTRRELVAQLDELRRDDSPLADPPRLPGARWVDPKLVIRAEFAEWTTDKLLRQAAYKGLEVGKSARSVRREVATSTGAATRAAERSVEKTAPKRNAPAPANGARPDEAVRGATPDEMAALDALGKQGTWAVGGRELKLTNLDKVLFPAQDGHPDVTKRDLIRYHVAIGPTLLPHLADRAVNLHRYPNGIGSGAGFWQKNLPGHTPQWVRRWRYVHREEGPKDYVVVDSVATLAWLAQEAAIELHPWTSRTDAPDRPTYALIDIDPGSRTTWDEVVILARLYRTALSHLSVTGLPKTTGKRGLQVWIPVKPIYGFDDTRSWVEALSRAIGDTVPDLVSWEWSKSERSGRARLDYTQNAINRTLVAPYSVRSAPGAPVSTPITWEELDDPELRSNRWTIRDLPSRVADVGDLFAPAATLEQDLPDL